MRKSTAVGGLILATYVSPFFDFGRRKLGLSPRTIKTYLANGATASLNGKSVELRYRDQTGSDRVAYGRAGFGHGNHATRWVNQFNKRASNA